MNHVSLLIYWKIKISQWLSWNHNWRISKSYLLQLLMENKALENINSKIF